MIINDTNVTAALEEAPMTQSPSKAARAFVRMRDRQIAEARDLTASASITDALVFRKSNLHKMLGPIAPGKSIFLGAGTGSGKTTLLMDLTEEFAADGHGVLFCGTEQKPAQLRRKHAAARLGFDLVLVEAGLWEQLPRGAKAEMDAELERMGQAPFDRVDFLPEAQPTASQIHEWMGYAADAGKKIVIIDHLQRLKLNDRKQERIALEDAIQTIVTRTEELGLISLTACQFNSGTRAEATFERYTRPELGFFRGSKTITFEASIALGLWRPLKASTSQRDKDEVIHEGRDIKELIEPDTMGIVCMKHRADGKRDNEVCYMHVENNMVTPDLDLAVRRKKEIEEKRMKREQRAKATIETQVARAVREVGGAILPEMAQTAVDRVPGYDPRPF